MRIWFVEFTSIVKNQDHIRLTFFHAIIRIIRQFGTDLEQIHGPLDDFVIVRKFFLVGQFHENDRQLSAFGIFILFDGVDEFISFTDSQPIERVLDLSQDWAFGFKVATQWNVEGRDAKLTVLRNGANSFYMRGPATSC